MQAGSLNSRLKNGRKANDQEKKLTKNLAQNEHKNKQLLICVLSYRKRSTRQGALRQAQAEQIIKHDELCYHIVLGA